MTSLVSCHDRSWIYKRYCVCVNVNINANANVVSWLVRQRFSLKAGDFYINGCTMCDLSRIQFLGCLTKTLLKQKLHFIFWEPNQVLYSATSSS